MVAGALEPNLLGNGSMEGDRDNDGIADGWFAEVHQHEGGRGSFEIDERVKVQGKFSQRINHTSVRGWVRISQDGIPAKPNAAYLFRCWVKATCRFLLIVYAFKSDGTYDTFVIATADGTRGNDWQLFGGLVQTPSDARSFKVSLVTDSGGVAWFDGAELILLERPTHILVPVAASAPEVDGHLSDECWRNVEPLTPFLELGSGKILEPQTVAKVVATSTHLFIAFHCIEPTPRAIRLRTPESGEPAYTDDCVEVYLDPKHSHNGFWQFVITPKGNKWAQQVDLSKWSQVWWLLPRPTQRIITNGWQGAARLDEGFWEAEIAIPFELLNLKPQAGSVIGINLCRSRKIEQGKRDKKEAEQNSAFAYFAPWTFQRPEKFPHAVLLEAGERSLEAKSELKSFKGKGAALDPLQMLTPKPQRVFLRGKAELPLRPPVHVVLERRVTELELTAVDQLLQTLRRAGIDARISPQPAANASSIILITVDELPSFHFPLPTDKLRTFFAQRGEEAYAIFVGMRDGGRKVKGVGEGRRQMLGVSTSHSQHPSIFIPFVVIVGASPRGILNGVQTVRQLIFFGSQKEGRIALRPCEIWDYPDLKLRGWHFVAPLRHELPFAEKFLEWLAAMKFNTLVVEIDDRFPYERHPDIAHPQALTKEQWRDFIAKARKLGFEVIPQVQTFGHFGYVLNKPAYRHLSEHDEPHPRWGFYAYCPSNPETYRLVFDLFDEVLEVFQPKWFHIGHDEITFVPIGVCERCRTTGKMAWQLLAEDIRRLYEYLKAKGVERVAMWCDQLEHDRTGGYAPYFTHFAADSIPKDIVQFCWHYDARQTFPWLTRLKDKGFDVVACSWYHAQNVWRFAAESFDRGALGYCGTTWYSITGFRSQVDLMTAVVLGAQNSWSVDNPPIDRVIHPTNVAQDLWALVGERDCWGDGVEEFICADLSPSINASLTKWGSESVIPDRYPELETLRGEIWCDGVPFKLVKGDGTPPQVVALSSDATSHELVPDLIAIPVGSRARALYFLMTTTARTTRTEDLYQRGRIDPSKVAVLIVRYADGSEERMELIFRRHLTEWNDRLGCSHARVVLQGKTQRGYLVTLCAFEWRNPKPDVPISSAILVSAATSVQPVLIALTIGK